MDTIPLNVRTINSQFGRLGIAETNGHVTHLLWHAHNEGDGSPLLQEALRQLQAYLDDKLDQFDLPLAPAGTEFQQKVYAAMLAIPKGHTRSYGDIANDLDVAAQPVGQACGSNPIPIIIPCHRVVAGNGLGGFSASGGVETKIQLLKFERAYSLLL